MYCWIIFEEFNGRRLLKAVYARRETAESDLEILRKTGEIRYWIERTKMVE